MFERIVDHQQVLNLPTLNYTTIDHDYQLLDNRVLLNYLKHHEQFGIEKVMLYWLNHQ